MHCNRIERPFNFFTFIRLFSEATSYRVTDSCSFSDKFNYLKDKYFLDILIHTALGTRYSASFESGPLVFPDSDTKSYSSILYMFLNSPLSSWTPFYICTLQRKIFGLKKCLNISQYHRDVPIKMARFLLRARFLSVLMTKILVILKQFFKNVKIVLSGS